MVAGPARRAKAKSRPARKDPLKAKLRSKGSSQQVRLDKDSQSLKIGRTTSTVRIGSESLSAIHAEAVNGIVEELLDRPDKILITARRVKNESYYRVKNHSRKHWMHYSQLKFANVSKSEYIAALSAFSTEAKIMPHWTDEIPNSSTHSSN